MARGLQPTCWWWGSWARAFMLWVSMLSPPSSASSSFCAAITCETKAWDGGQFSSLDPVKASLELNILLLVRGSSLAAVHDPSRRPL